MNRFLQKLDRNYIKIALYVLGTFFTALIIIGLAYLSGGFWHKVGIILQTIMRPLVIGLVITYLLSPVTSFFQRKLAGLRRGSRALAVALTMLLIAAVLAAVVGVFVITVSRQISGLDLNALQDLGAQIQSQYSRLIDSIMNYLQQQGLSSERLGARLQSLASRTISVLENLFFGLIFSIYFLYDGKRIGAYWKRVVDTLLPDRFIQGASVFLKDADQAFSGYIRGQFTDALIVGVLVSAALTIAGVPYGPVIGIITGIGNMIPYLGPILGYVMIILSGLVSQDINAMILGIVILGIIQVIDGNVINPRLLSNAIHIHPLFVIVCVLTGGAIGGLVGMLISVPAGALLKKEFERLLEYRESRKTAGAEKSKEAKIDRV